MAIELTDDGTFDTVLRCSECGEEFRYTYDPTGADPVEHEHCEEHDDYTQGCRACTLADEQSAELAYDAFIKWTIEDATADHECPTDDEPDEDSITTTDHETFYQYGRKVFRTRCE